MGKKKGNSSKREHKNKYEGIGGPKKKSNRRLLENDVDILEKRDTKPNRLIEEKELRTYGSKVELVIKDIVTKQYLVLGDSSVLNLASRRFKLDNFYDVLSAGKDLRDRFYVQLYLNKTKNLMLMLDLPPLKYFERGFSRPDAMLEYNVRLGSILGYASESRNNPLRQQLEEVVDGYLLEINKGKFGAK
ncbi:MAG: hypothetical protein Q8Q35_04205 [Nanoarchaeota archaeon]|nr:hypothetical protein [Nanoarchaeota archaeon]